MGAGYDLPPPLCEPGKRRNTDPRRLAPATQRGAGPICVLHSDRPGLAALENWVSGLLTSNKARLGLRTGIWGTGCSTKEPDLVPQALSVVVRASKREAGPGHVPGLHPW